MYEHQILKIKDYFQLQNQGLVVVPDFSVPENGKWVDFSSKANVLSPDGDQSLHKIHVGITHFNIRDPHVAIDKRWRVIVSFPDSSKEEIPIGSEVYVSKKDYETIIGKNT